MKHTAEEPPATAYPLGPVLEFLRELWALNHALERRSKRMETRLGLTAQQRVALRIIGKYPGITAGQLAKLLHIDAGTLSATTRRLEERGLLERRKDARDGRRVMLVLTAAGHTRASPAPITVESAVEEVLGKSSTADIAAVRSVIERLVEAVDRVD